MTDDDEIELLELLQIEERERRRDEARSSLLGFTQYTYGDEFPYRANWHHEVLCSYLDDLLAGVIKHLLVTMPPRHGKSELVSRRLPAYALGRNPRESVIACSYSDDLASRMNRDVQRIIDSNSYRELFPNTRLPGKGDRSARKKRNNDFFELMDADGAYRSAGVGGGITGMGASLGIIDDPVKNQKEALSLTLRQSQWEWYTTTFRTRMQRDSGELITLTRWNEDDIAGRLEAMVSSGVLDGDNWVTLSLPAINEKGPSKDDPREIGDALWPSEYGLSFLDEMRVTLGSQAFSSLYQQRPSAAEGGIVKRAWLTNTLYERLPENVRYLLSADLSFDINENGSYNVLQVWAWIGANIYLVDQIRERCEFVESLRHFDTLTKRYPQATIKLVEKKANGAALISMLRSKVQGIIAVEPHGSKVARLTAVSPLFEAGNIHLPTWRVPWVGQYIEELVTFPNAANDDQVDATSQALNRLRGETIKLVGPDSNTRSSPTPQ